MLTKRIIPCLDIKDGKVVKGVNFVGLKDVGDPIELAKKYDVQCADEVVFLDITASYEDRGIMKDIIERGASELTIPLAVGGGIRTLDDFRMDLINLQEKYDSEVENTPLGIYSIVKNNNKSLDDEIKPGVIYCLKKTDSYKNESDKNPIYPYYMAYVKEDGEIIYNYSNVKKILDIYKALCMGNNKVINDLVEEFNEETKNQKKMDKYKDLLTDVTDDILGKIEEQDTLNIFSLGDLSGMLDNNTNQEEFEIVSYLVIK